MRFVKYSRQPPDIVSVLHSEVTKRYFCFLVKKNKQVYPVGDENRAFFRGFKFTPCRQNLVNSSALVSSIRYKK